MSARKLWSQDGPSVVTIILEDEEEPQQESEESVEFKEDLGHVVFSALLGTLEPNQEI